MSQVPTDARGLTNRRTQLQRLLESATPVVFAKDREGRYLFVNREWERVHWGRTGDVTGLTDFDIFPTDVAAQYRRNDLLVLADECAHQFEENVVVDGIERTYVTAKFPLLDASGRPYAVCGMATDTTERRRIEDALSSSALAVSSGEGDTLFSELVRYLATILDVDSAFISKPIDGGETMRMLAIHMNGETREHFDYSIAGTACQTVMGKGFGLYQSGLADLLGAERQFVGMRPDSYAGCRLNDSTGRAMGVIAVISRRPIVNPAFFESVLKIFAVRAAAELERVQASAALRASETSYREIFGASEDAIFVHDWETGAIVDANERACALYGYSREEFTRLTPDELGSGIPPYRADLARRMFAQAKRDGIARFEWHRRNRDGSLHWDDVCLKSARIGGQPRLLAFTRDITARKEAEERRSRLEAQLRQAQKMEAIGQLTGGIAHDFNNLLTSIMGYVVLGLESDTTRADLRLTKYLGEAHRSCERARDLIQQMLMFSRGQRGAPQPHRLPRLVRDCLPLVRSSMPGTLEIVTEIDEEVPTVRIDALQLEQVLLNLCINARDALDGKGGFRISVRRLHPSGAACASCRHTFSGDYVALAVEDEGPGMSPDVAERIFEPFFSTKTAQKGTGMGLAIIHGIVHEHGGHVLVDTAAGQGARFQALFPCLDDGDERDVPHANGSMARSAVRPVLRGRALVIDDELAVGEFMRELLSSWGMEADFVSRPEDGVATVSRHADRYDIVITDLSMARVTGLDVAKRVREIRRDLPVVIYTAYAEELSEHALESAGVSALVRKPVDPTELARVLTRLLQA